MSAVIKVDNVSMMFNLSSEKIDSIKEYIIKLFKKEIHFQEFWALKDVSFELEKGDSLGIIGFNMIHESLSKSCEKSSADFSAKAMFPLAIATSIDALAVGISLAFLKENILWAATTIGITTFALSAVGLYIGNAFGCRYKSKAEFLGGAVLVMIGIKILIEHTLN